MTIKECIDIVDDLKPNQYSTKVKVMWLSFIDEIIINDVLKTHKGYDGRYDDFTGYSEDKLSVPLIVESPYDRLYTAYLKMKIDGENGETTRYNNSAGLFNSYMMEYRKFYNKTHMPLSAAEREKANCKATKLDVTEAQLEYLKRELYPILAEDINKAVSNDKIYDIVMNYVNNNAQMLKGKDGVDGVNGKDGYTPIKGKDYFDGKQGKAFTYDDFTQAQLDALRGEKGDKGDKGDQGARGVQGVQGEKGDKGDKGEDGKDAVIDQTYSPTSKNAQSGVAVSQALKTLKTADGTVVSQNADFAEVAEWADGNPNNEDRTGYFVCANVPVDGIVMKKATSIDDVKGVSILAPAFAGNYTKDKLDANGNLLPKYSYVAIIGFVPVIDNGTCTVGGRCMPDDNGCAIPSSNSMGYQVVNRIDENRVLIIIEPNGDMVQRIKTKVNQMQEIFASTIKTSAFGETLNITDISPVEHTVEVDVSSDTIIDLTTVEVKTAGKNLIDTGYKTDMKTGYTIAGLTFIVNEDNSITINGTAQWEEYPTIAYYKQEAGKTYTMSGTPNGSSDTYHLYTTYKRENGGTTYYPDTSKGKITFTVGASNFVGIRLKVFKGVVMDNVTIYPQIEVGNTATEYEKYCGDTYTPNTDGIVEGVVSISPTMNIYPNTTGVLVKAEYNADTKKYIDNKFAELQALVLEG